MPPSPTYKRDQVEKACAICAGLWDGPNQVPVPNFATDLKRLLVLDRKQGRTSAVGVSPRYAFHEAPPLGRGKDVGYSAYDAFALLTGALILHSGDPQARCVSFLRELRPDLEAAHTRIMQTPSLELQPEDYPEATATQELRDGVLVRDAEAMEFLVAFAGDKASYFSSNRDGVEVSGNICTHQELVDRLRFASHMREALLVIELVNAAHQLRYHLDRITPRSRGRS